MTSISGLTSSDQQQMDFMKLLVAELQNQNPLEPMNNTEMAAQLAQFTQLSLSEETNSNIAEMNATMEKMNASFHGAMLVAELDYAKSLLGKEVAFYSGAHEQYLSGKVEAINIVDGKPQLSVRATITAPDTTQEERIFPIKLNEITGIKSEE
jgi:flagellar basal-body rod modification protein FlgD